MPGIFFVPYTAWHGNAIHLNSAEFHSPCSFIYETCSLFSRTSVFRSLSLWFLASHVFLAIFSFHAAAAFHVTIRCVDWTLFDRIPCRCCCCWHVHHSIAAMSVICKFKHGQWQPMDNIKLTRASNVNGTRRKDKTVKPDVLCAFVFCCCLHTRPQGGKTI